MKNLLAFILAILFNVYVFSQESPGKQHKIPAVQLKTLDGKSFNTADISNNGKPVILSFWATFCKPCIKELSSIAEVYDDWQDETGVKIIAVSTDDARTSRNVKPMVNGRNWPYEVLLDDNSDFKRAMQVQEIPYTIILNGKGDIVWRHAGSKEGEELLLIDRVRKIIAGGDINDSQ